jgi:uncharacterized protein YdaU (DUF1376 family)
MHYYKFNVSSWAKDTGHLSLKEEAIYLRLINYYYDYEKPIPLKTQMVLRKLRMADESETVDLILEEFFTKTKDGWTHHHCDELIAEYQKKAETNRKNGKSGGRPKINDLEEATGLPVDTEEEPSGNLNHELLTINDKLLTNNDLKDLSACADVPAKKTKSKPEPIKLDEQRILDVWNELGCIRHRSITKEAVKQITKTYKEYCKATDTPVQVNDWIVSYLKNGFSKWMTDHHRQLNDGKWAADLAFAVRHDTYDRVKSTVVTKQSSNAVPVPEMTKEERDERTRRELEELLRGN